MILIAQENSVKISGSIVDIETLETIPFVHVVIKGNQQGTISDIDGNFEIETINRNEIVLEFFHTSYKQKTVVVEASEPQGVIVRLEPRLFQTKEVIVVENNQSFTKGYIPGKIQIKQQDILITPTVLGEPDLVRTLQLLPGIQSVNEGNSGIYVRGGSPGQNYIVFDEIELMNPSHLMGIYSVFNPLLVDRVEFFKGNAPIQYSSRIASSIIVNTISSPTGEYNWSGNVGNITSDLCYQGKSKNDKWSTSVGYRRSYLEAIQLLAKQFIKEENNYFTNNKFNFYDFNGKINFRSGVNNLSLSWYKGEDVVNYSNSEKEIEMNNNWGNEGASLVWNMLITPDFSMKNVISYSGYRSSLQIGLIDQDLNLESDYKHIQFKNEYLYHRNSHLIRWGVQSKYRRIAPHDMDVSLNTNEGKSFNLYKHLGIKLFTSDHFNISDKLDFYLGIANEYYRHIDKNTKGFSEDVNYQKSLNKDRFLWNGVFTFNYNVTPTSSIKGSYSYVSQDIHLTSIASMPLPSDIWMPATQKVPSESGHQYTLGYFKENDDLGIQYGIESYAKWLQDQLLLNVNISGEEITDFEDNFFRGEGKAYGAEVFVKKKGSKFNANLSYTLGWVKQKFNSINEGKWYDAKYDRRHDLNILCAYKVNNQIEIAGVFIFASGNKATLPVGRYWLMGSISNDYEGVNNYRMPVYHRLDLSLNYHLKSKLFKESTLNFSLVNVLNRSNPYFIYYSIKEGKGKYDLDIKAHQVSLFPILPSLSWNFKF